MNKNKQTNKTVTETDNGRNVVVIEEVEKEPLRKRMEKLRRRTGKKITKKKIKVNNVWERVIQPKLEEITDWRREWRSVKWICSKLGISTGAFYKEAKLHPEIGKAMLDAQVGMEDTGVGRLADIFMGRAKKRETVVGIDRGQKVDYERVRDYEAPERAGMWLLGVYMGLANRQQAPTFELSKAEYEQRLAMDFGHKEFVNLQERDRQAGLTDDVVLGKIVFEPKRFGKVADNGVGEGTKA